MNTWRRFSLSPVLPALAAGILLAGSPAPAADHPNLVLILIDDMGYECVTPDGGRSYHTPEFERLARDGVRFTNCYSQPVCTPSRVKIMTGRYNFRNYKAFGVLIPEETTFAQVLKTAGYKTCIAGKWQLTGGGPGSGTEGWGTTPESAGFDEICIWAYPHYLTPEDRAAYEASAGVHGKTSRYWHPAILKNGKYLPTTDDDFGPDIYSHFVLDFIERHRSEPFLVYYPMTLTHGPFVPTPHSKVITGKAKRSTHTEYFGDMVTYADHIVGRIRGRLDELGLSENTLLLVVADNGTARNITSLFEDRAVKGGKATPVDAGNHVPFFARWKGVTQAGSVRNELLDFSDFLPTLVDAAGAKLPKGLQIDGRSLLPLLRGEAYQSHDWIFQHYDRDPNIPKAKWPRVRFARTERYKLYHDGRFYDVPHDWDEKDPIAPGAEPPGAAKARKLLQSVLDSMPPWHPK